MISEENGYFLQNEERLYILLKVQSAVSLFHVDEFLKCFFGTFQRY